MQKVAVVVLNFNGKKFLETFLEKLVEYSPEKSVWVIDNNSEDDSVEYLKASHSNVHLVQNTENGGFSKGYNDGLRQIQAEYYVLINSDIEVTKNWLVPVIQFMDENTSVAACQPKIRSFDQREYFEYAGASGGFIDKFGYPFCRGRIFNTLEKDSGQYDNIIPIFWASGACFFVRSEVYWALGGLDENYFAHMEEIDLCWRIHRAGYKIYVIPESKVYHVGGGTLKSESPFKTFLNFRNSLYTLYRNVKPGILYRYLLVRFLLDVLALVFFLLKGKFSHSSAVLKANWQFYTQKRPPHVKELPYHFDNEDEVIYGNLMLVDYYLKRKKAFKNPKQSASFLRTS